MCSLFSFICARRLVPLTIYLIFAFPNETRFDLPCAAKRCQLSSFARCTLHRKVLLGARARVCEWILDHFGFSCVLQQPGSEQLSIEWAKECATIDLINGQSNHLFWRVHTLLRNRCCMQTKTPFDRSQSVCRQHE